MSLKITFEELEEVDVEDIRELLRNHPDLGSKTDNPQVIKELG